MVSSWYFWPFYTLVWFFILYSFFSLENTAAGNMFPPRYFPDLHSPHGSFLCMSDGLKHCCVGLRLSCLDGRPLQGGGGGGQWQAGGGLSSLYVQRIQVVVLIRFIL